MLHQPVELLLLQHLLRLVQELKAHAQEVYLLGAHRGVLFQVFRRPTARRPAAARPPPAARAAVADACRRFRGLFGRFELRGLGLAPLGREPVAGFLLARRSLLAGKGLDFGAPAPLPLALSQLRLALGAAKSAASAHMQRSGVSKETRLCARNNPRRRPQLSLM